jgi:aldehyde:ferredoxin oxidoreductase
MTREELLQALDKPWGRDPYLLIERARAQIEADGKRIAELEQWKAAIDEALVCNHLGTADDFPSAKDALQRLIGWEISMALDPEISVDARSLQAEATAALEAENARLRDVLAKMQKGD